MSLSKNIVFTAVVIALCLFVSCTDMGSNAVKAKAGEAVEVSVQVGKSVLLTPDHTVIEFSKVEADGRCPADVRCVWQGEAEIMLTLYVGNGVEHRRVKIPGLVRTPYRGETVDIAGYRIRLLQLDPYPYAEQRNTLRTYEARLEIEKIR